MTLLRSASKGILTSEMEQVASKEGVSPGMVMKGVAEGKIVILRNPLHHSVVPTGIGPGAEDQGKCQCWLVWKECRYGGRGSQGGGSRSLWC